MNDLEVLNKIKDVSESEQLKTDVANAEIHSPINEVESSLSTYVVNKLDRLEKNEKFVDLVRLYIKDKLPEANFDQLMQLEHSVSQDNNRAVNDFMRLFKNENSGKTIVDTMKSTETSDIANKMYNSTDDKKVLQAVTYLSQVLETLNKKEQK